MNSDITTALLMLSRQNIFLLKTIQLLVNKAGIEKETSGFINDFLHENNQTLDIIKKVLDDERTRRA